MQERILTNRASLISICTVLTDFKTCVYFTADNDNKDICKYYQKAKCTSKVAQVNALNFDWLLIERGENDK